MARKSALSYKVLEKDVTILENFNFDQPKTKLYLELLNSLSFSGKKTLMVIPESDKNIVLSGRNVPKAKVSLATDINTYDVLNADKLILCEGSIEKIENILN